MDERTYSGQKSSQLSINDEDGCDNSSDSDSMGGYQREEGGRKSMLNNNEVFNDLNDID